MSLFFSNNLSTIASGGQIRMSGLTGSYASFNGVPYTLYDCNSASSPYQYRITIVPPSGTVTTSCSITAFSTSATATGVTGISASLSNLFSPSANVITGMSSGYLQKYTLSGDVATQVYSCNISLYNGIGGVPNLASTLIPEVYTLISSAGQILVVRNVY